MMVVIINNGRMSIVLSGCNLEALVTVRFI